MHLVLRSSRFLHANVIFLVNMLCVRGQGKTETASCPKIEGASQADASGYLAAC